MPKGELRATLIVKGMKVKSPFKAGTRRTCKLDLFTWLCLESENPREVVPICPTHVHSKVRSGPFGTDIILVCESGKHLVGLCERDEFEAEQEQAKAELNP
jgi:hypothetical protein